MGVKASEAYKERLAQLVKTELKKSGSYDKLTVAIALKAGNSPSSELLRKWQNGKFSEEPGDENLAQLAALLDKDLETLRAELRGEEIAKKSVDLGLAKMMQQEPDLVAIAEAVAIGIKRLSKEFMGRNPLTLNPLGGVNSCEHLLAATGKGMAINPVTQLIWQVMTIKGLNPSDRNDVIDFLGSGMWLRNPEARDHGIKIVAGEIENLDQADLAAIAGTLTKFTGSEYTQDELSALLAQDQNPTQLPEQGHDCSAEGHHNSIT